MKLLLDSETALCDREAFDALPEYSTTIPTSPRPGTRWKAARPWWDKNPIWWLGEAQLDPDPEFVRIRWRRLEVVE